MKIDPVRLLTLILLAAAPAAALTNPAFMVTDPAAPQFGWETRGAVSVQDGAALLQEDDHVLTRLAQTFTIPQGAKSLRFTIVRSGLTARDPLQPPDAFEVALLDSSTSESLIGTATGLSDTDSILNLQPTGEVFFSPKVRVPGATSGQVASLQLPLTVEVDLRGLAAGTRATLSFDLLGFSPLGSSVAIDNVFLMRDGAIPPVVVAGGPYSGLINQPITFDGGGSSDADSPIILYEWDFESDGVFDVSSGSPTATHAYPAAGTFTVTLRVTDDTGLTATDTASVVIRPPSLPPVAVPQGPATANEGQTVTFSGAGSSDPDGDALTYQWSFGDGGSGGGASVTHVFTDNGTYQVSLTVTDPAGLSDTKAIPVTVANVAPAVDALQNATVVAGDPVSITGRFTDPGADSWTATVDYGDGSGIQPLALRPDKTFELRHTYAAAGTFTVNVAVKDDDGGIGSGRVKVIVQPRNRPPVAVLQGPSNPSEGQAYKLSGAGSSDPDGDALSYAWSFGDGGSASGKDVTHTFADNRVYPVSLTVTDPGGLSTTKTLSLAVANAVPEVNAGPDVSIAPGATLSATGRFTDLGADTWTAKVDYGDGTGQQTLTLRPDKTFELRHTYPAVGVFTVRVTVTDDDGGAGSDTVVVTVNRPPVCTGAKASPDRLWPPNHQYVAIQVQGVTDPDNNPVKIVVDRIRQDEPVKGTGDGDTAPDGEGVGTAAVRVRSERAGTGNGRVYHIFFTATDGKGGACSGEVRVGVPHDQGQGSVPVDDGSLFDSTAAG